MSRRSNKPATIPITPLAPTPLISISDDNSKVIALLPSGDRLEVLLYGATIVSWKPAGGRENLFLSEKAHLDGSKPVRGGIPVVFPLFGPPTPGHATEKLGQHGFARSSRWEYLGKTTSESSIQPGSAGDSSVKLDFGLSDGILNESVRAAWPHRFGLTYSITLTPGELETGLLVRNTDETPFEFKTLFHTYFKVDNISDVSITGLESATYHDKVASKPESAATGSALTFSGETDRVYSAGDAPITVLEGKEPLYEIKRDALPDVVTWNPWAEKAKSMADLGPEHGWKELVCVEAGAVAQWLKLEAGDTWYGGQRITAL